jgi:hypothetical protein
MVNQKEYSRNKILAISAVLKEEYVQAEVAYVCHYLNTN